MTHWTEDAFVSNPEVFRPDLEAHAEAAGEEVDQLLALLADEHDLAPATALDVPCGIARHAVPLADRGVAVTGVDLSPEYVERARERAAEAGVDDAVTVHEGDMRDLGGVVDGRFDLVLNMWTSFGYYDEATDRAVLAALRERVAEGGALVMEMANKEGVLANFQPDGVDMREGHVSFETREYDPVASRMHTEREVFAKADEGLEHLGTMTYETRMFDPARLREWLLDAGFATVSTYADLDGAEVSRESTRMVVVASP